MKTFQHDNRMWAAELTEVFDGGGLRDHLLTFRCPETATCVTVRTSTSPNRMSQPELVAALVRAIGRQPLRRRQRGAAKAAAGW